ncbi:MAG: Ig-like domain-containing protein [Candidatus Cryptobacteroides sp.]|nr:Ig-like domain-containing protein [Candidatus Cryptobacteroides sp.]
MLANFKIKSMRYLMVLAIVLISLSPISCEKEKGGSSELREIVITHPENGTMTIMQGESELIKYSTVPAEAEYEVALEWTSDDENVATVKNGRVRAHAPGTTTVHAKYESVSASVKVTVTAVPVTSFGVPSSMSAYLDMPTPVRLTVQPENANAASLQWDTDNPGIAYVEVNQGVAYIKAAKEGSCTISAYAENISTTRKIKVTVYPTLFSLKRRSESDGYVTIENGGSFDLLDMGMPAPNGYRTVEMIREDGGTLTESAVTVTSDETSVISVSKRLLSESKINIEVVEGSTSGSAKISVALNEDGIKYEKTFTINKGVHPFTSETKICWIYTDEAVKDVEEMSRNANAEVQINPAVNASWTSSNEAVAKVTPRTVDGKGVSPMAEIQTFGEYGSAEITATDETGKNTRSFTVRVSKASFPAGTKICIRVGGKIEPVGESTTIRASYDGRNDEAFGLMDASGNYLSTFTNFKWTIESPSCECRLATAGASGVVVTPISATTFSGSKTATLVCTDDAGNRLTHKIFIDSPNAFSGVQNLRVTVDGKSYTSNAKVDIGKTATIDIAKLAVDSSYDGLKWENVGVLGSVYGTTKLNNNSSGSLMSIEFTPNRKMEAMPISVEDEIGQVRKIYISSAEFQFPEGAKLYYSYGNVDPTGGYWSEVMDGMPLKNDAGTYLKIATSAAGKPIVDKAYWDQIWASAIEKSKNHSYIGEFDDIRINVLRPWNIFGVFTKKYPTKYQEPEYYSIEAKDDYGTALSARFYIREWVKFDSDTRFEIGKNKGNLFIDYNNGSSESIKIPKSELFSDGSIFVRVKFGNVLYRFPRIIVTNSAKQDNPYEYYLYHERFIREYPTSSGPATRLIFSDDFGNMKTFTFTTY